MKNMVVNQTCADREPGQCNEYKALNYCTKQLTGTSLSCNTDQRCKPT